MKSLDRTLELLRDANWHSVEELQKEIAMPSDAFNKVLIFLQEQAFIDKENGKLRITPVGLKLLELPL